MERLFGTMARIVAFVRTTPARQMTMIQIRAVMFPEVDVWYAQCLEHDIAVEAPTFDDLKSELKIVLSVQAELALETGREPFASLPPAPAKYFRMFEQFEHGDGVEQDYQIALGDSVTSCVMARFSSAQSA